MAWAAFAAGRLLGVEQRQLGRQLGRPFPVAGQALGGVVTLLGDEVELGERVVAVGCRALGRGRRRRQGALAAVAGGRRVGLRGAGRAERSHRLAMGRLGGRRGVGRRRGPGAGLVERRAGGAGRVGGHPPATGTEAAAGAGDDHGLGVGQRDVDGGRPAALDGDGRTEQTVEQGCDLGTAGTDVGQHGLARWRGRAARGRHPQGQHGARHVAGGQHVERPATGRHGVDDHGGEGLAAGGLGGGLPPGIDVDEIEKRAHDAVDGSQAGGAGPRPGGVERLGECVGPGGPRVSLGPGGVPPLLGGPGGVLGRLARRGRPRDGADHVGLGRQGRDLLGRPCRLGVEAFELGPEVGDAALRLVGVGVGPVEDPAQRAELAPHLGGPAGGGGNPLAPLGLVRLVRGGEVGLGRRQRGDVGVEALGLAAQRVDVGLQPGGIGLEAGDDSLVDRCGTLAVDAAAALGQERQLPSGLLTQRLRTRQGVADLAAAERGQLGLGPHHRQVELGQPGRQHALLVAELGLGRGGVAQATLERRQLAARDEHLQGPQLGHQVAVATGRIGLPFERPELAAHLAEQVVQPGEVPLGGGQPALGPFLALAVLEHARGLFDDEPSVLGAGVEHRVDLPLAHDHVLLATHPGVAEQLLHVEEAAGHVVDGVLALARPPQRAGDRHLAELDGEQPGAVVDRQADLGPPERLALGRAREDDVLHLLAADRGGRLGAEHPADGVHHVRLARAVGAHHDGDPRLHLEHGGLREGLEPLEGQRLEEHREKG